jgi:hypothetical protein
VGSALTVAPPAGGRRTSPALSTHPAIAAIAVWNAMWIATWVGMWIATWIGMWIAT